VRRPLHTQDPLADFARHGLISRYCFGCHHAQWNHAGVYPHKRQCNADRCKCTQYLELTREQADRLLR